MRTFMGTKLGHSKVYMISTARNHGKSMLTGMWQKMIFSKVPTVDKMDTLLTEFADEFETNETARVIRKQLEHKEARFVRMMTGSEDVFCKGVYDTLYKLRNQNENTI